MTKQGKLGEQKRYVKYKRSPAKQVKYESITAEQLENMKVKPRSWARHDFIIPGVNTIDIQKFYNIFKQTGLKNQCQVFRLLLYRYEEEHMKNENPDN